jgi:predicted DNA-binding transcriptional regulator YafY
LSRAQRLLDLIQVLRRHRRPVSGGTLADAVGVSLRTLYRDIDTLKAQGAHIDGEPGVGYVLRPGFLLPPLMFSEEEIEALVLGSRWVAERADAPLGDAARNALAKIAAVLPDDLRDSLDATNLLIGPGNPVAAAMPNCGPSATRSAPSASCVSIMPTARAPPRSARSGRSRSPSSNAYVWS